jgi:hypothetical protein
MTCTYYEVDIIHTSSSDNGDKFYNNGEETIPFETVEKVKEWLDQKYGSEHTLFKVALCIMVIVRHAGMYLNLKMLIIHTLL